MPNLTRVKPQELRNPLIAKGMELLDANEFEALLCMALRDEHEQYAVRTAKRILELIDQPRRTFWCEEHQKSAAYSAIPCMCGMYKSLEALVDRPLIRGLVREYAVESSLRESTVAMVQQAGKTRYERMLGVSQ